MQRQKTIIVFIIIAIIIVMAVMFLHLKQRLNFERISPKSASEPIVEPQQALINQKIQQIRQELNKKSQEEIKSQGYTQEEIDFIRNKHQTSHTAKRK